MHTAIVILGVGSLAAVLGDAFEVMLLPRRVRRKMRLVTYLLRSTWFVWSAVAMHLRSGPRRDSFLSLYGPFSLLLLIGTWVAGLITAFGAISWGLSLDPVHGILNHLYFSGITFFTVGYGDLTPKTPEAKVAAVIEAGTGLAFLATVIGYLPVLYQPFLAGLAEHLVLEVPGWLAPKVQLDNWQVSPRGRSAKQLVESAPANP